MPVLQAYDIERLVDIRTIPRSRHNPQFNETALAESLKAHHLQYVHLKALGGLRHPRKDSHNTGWRNEVSRLCRLYANRRVSGRARGAHSHEPPKARWDHVRRSGAVAMPPFAGGRCAQRAWCTGRRDFIREQLPDASAHTIRAGGGPANYLSTRASYIAVSLARIAGTPIGTLGGEVWLCDRLRSPPVRAGKAEAGASFADYFDLSAGSPSTSWVRNLVAAYRVNRPYTPIYPRVPISEIKCR
jgi:hypothetical protein